MIANIIDIVEVDKGCALMMIELPFLFVLSFLKVFIPLCLKVLMASYSNLLRVSLFKVPCTCHALMEEGIAYLSCKNNVELLL